MTALSNLLDRLMHGDPEMIAVGIGAIALIIVMLAADRLINGPDASNSYKSRRDR